MGFDLIKSSDLRLVSCQFALFSKSSFPSLVSLKQIRLFTGSKKFKAKSFTNTKTRDKVTFFSVMFALRRPVFSTRFFSSVAKNMEKHGVVPDVIDVAPETVVEVTYPSGAKADLGNKLTPRQVKDVPTVKWTVENNVLYTLCMTDPDAPSREAPKFREWHHWLVGNIPGHNVELGDILSAYVGSGPPEGTGFHRYVFLVYKQNGKINFDEKRLPNNSGDGRGCFSIRKFAEKYKLGQPVAGNLYQAEWDDYVPLLYKQLGG
jgi:hypothetical protein